MAKLVELGHLKPTDLLWREGFPDWRPAMVVFRRAGPRAPGAAHAGRRGGGAGTPGMMAEPLAGPSPEIAPDEDKEGAAAPAGVLARIAGSCCLSPSWRPPAGAAYVYRAELTAAYSSFSQSSSGPPVAERRSLELPPLAGFRAGSGEAVDAALQSTALWKVIEREFPEWYGNGRRGGRAGPGEQGRCGHRPADRPQARRAATAVTPEAGLPPVRNGSRPWRPPTSTPLSACAATTPRRAAGFGPAAVRPSR